MSTPTVYAILVKENEYPCGNIFGIYAKREEAVAKVAEMEPKLRAVAEYNNEIWRKDHPNPPAYHSLSERWCVELTVVELPMNTWLPASATSCANCMSLANGVADVDICSLTIKE